MTTTHATQENHPAETYADYLSRDHAADLKLAAERLASVARHTHLEESQILSEMTGARVLLKPENLQKTGSFKLRGAYNKIASLSQDELDRGIITASAGNHAQGVAYAARERGDCYAAHHAANQGGCYPRAGCDGGARG